MEGSFKICFTLFRHLCLSFSARTSSTPVYTWNASSHSVTALPYISHNTQHYLACYILFIWICFPFAQLKPVFPDDTFVHEEISSHRKVPAYIMFSVNIVEWLIVVYKQLKKLLYHLTCSFVFSSLISFLYAGCLINGFTFLPRNYPKKKPSCLHNLLLGWGDSMFHIGPLLPAPFTSPHSFFVPSFIPPIISGPHHWTPNPNMEIRKENVDKTLRKDTSRSKEED